MTATRRKKRQGKARADVVTKQEQPGTRVFRLLMDALLLRDQRLKAGWEDLLFVVGGDEDESGAERPTRISFPLRAKGGERRELVIPLGGELWIRRWGRDGYATVEREDSTR